MSFLDKLTTDSDRETPHLQAVCPANTTRFEVTKEVPFDGTVERVTLWSVPGSEDALELRPIIISGDSETSALAYGEQDHAENFVTGEPDDTPYRISKSVTQGDEVGVLVNNNSTQYPYRFRVQFEIDYAGGIKRVLGGI